MRMHDQDFDGNRYYVLEALDQNGCQHSSCIQGVVQDTCRCQCNNQVLTYAHSPNQTNCSTFSSWIIAFSNNPSYFLEILGIPLVPGHLASLHIITSVSCCKRCFSPVQFNESRLSGPFLTIPQAGKHTHQPLTQAWHTQMLIVFVPPDGCVIHHEDNHLLAPLNHVAMGVSCWIKP